MNKRDWLVPTVKNYEIKWKKMRSFVTFLLKERSKLLK